MEFWEPEQYDFDLGLSDGENTAASQHGLDLTGEDENAYDPQRDDWLFQEDAPLPPPNRANNEEHEEPMSLGDDTATTGGLDLGGTALSPINVEEEAIAPAALDLPLKTAADVCKLIIDVALQPQGAERLKAMKIGTFFQKNTSHFIEFLRQLLYRGSLSDAHKVTEVIDAVKRELSRAERIALLPIWTDELSKVMRIASFEERETFIAIWLFLRDHYVINSTALTVPAQSRNNARTIEEYYQVRDDLVHVGLWVDTCVRNWRRWPANGRGTKFFNLEPKMYGTDRRAIRLGATLSPTLSPTHDLDVLRIFQSTIPVAKELTGGVLRLDLTQHAQFAMMQPIFRHVLTVVEQAVVRSLGHIQFIVLVPQQTGYEGKIFVGGARYNWTQKAGGIKSFVAPLTRLVSYPKLSEDIADAARDISELLLPENLTVSQGEEPLIHAGGIRIHARTIGNSPLALQLFRHLAAIGNRDSPWPIDIHVSVLPYNPHDCRRVLDFLLCLSQVWSRRLIVSEHLAKRLLDEGFNKDYFWDDSPLHYGWPRFKKEGSSYMWIPTFFSKKAGNNTFDDLQTYTKPEIAPSDGQPKFPRGRYGGAKK